MFFYLHLGREEWSGAGINGHPAAHATRTGQGAAPKAAQPPSFGTALEAGNGEWLSLGWSWHSSLGSPARPWGGHTVTPSTHCVSLWLQQRSGCGGAALAAAGSLLPSVAARIAAVSAGQNRGLFSAKLSILQGIAESVWVSGEN